MAFSFTHDGLGDAVLERARDGCQVRGIFEARGSNTPFSELRRFYRANLSMRQDGNPRCFHHKVFILDERIVVTGSFNFSVNANESNDETWSSSTIRRSRPAISTNSSIGGAKDGHPTRNAWTTDRVSAGVVSDAAQVSRLPASTETALGHHHHPPAGSGHR